ncbi:MAG: circularly permuted type 2 ATP-grasp protein [Nitrospirae bacterium]|nr:MAG: circularly permuted type 2 ATP-grasp protein [Nitrospirota bacterium]
MQFTSYDPENFYDETFEGRGRPRPGCTLVMEKIAALTDGELKRRQQAAERVLLDMGVTFGVQGEGTSHEHIFPFDIVPRIVEAAVWERLERGLRQRVTALNCFLQDVYHDKKIIKDGIIPGDLVASSKGFLKACEGLNPPKGIWCHIAGIDLVRVADGTFHVLEDNMRCPSGVAYVLEARQVMKRTFPELFEASRVRPVDEYPGRLLDTLQCLTDRPDPTVVILTPGIYNSAYYEHSFLAQKMGVELVEGADLVAADGFVQMRTTRGLKRVDVIYRRVNDEFLDPLVFREESLLGVPGLMDAYRKGRVALANAPGTGVADDKAIYAYVEKFIRYYLGEEPVIPNVPTYLCSDEKDRAYVLDHLDQLVVKATNEAGGHGMLIGSQAGRREREEFAGRILADPRNYIAQPVLALSRVPTICGDHFEGRHVDLRPYILYGRDIHVMPGGLTRVALRKGSLVVNSCQGGGNKDTWVLSGRDKPC